MKGYLSIGLLVVAKIGLGLLAGQKIHDDVKENVFTILGMMTLLVGIKMCLQGSDIIPMEFALVLGAFAGSILQFEDRVHGNLNRLNDAYLSFKSPCLISYRNIS